MDSQPMDFHHISSFHVCVCSITELCPTLCNPWTVAHQTSLSKGFPRHEYWSGFSFNLPEDLPDSGIELESPVAPALAGKFLTTEPTRKPSSFHNVYLFIQKLHVQKIKTEQSRNDHGSNSCPLQQKSRILITRP